MKRVIWSADALRDIDRLHAFIAEVNPQAARRAIKAIRAGVRILRTSAAIGRPVSDLPADYRERVISFGASTYVLRYRVEPAHIVILAIWHGREAGYS